MKIASKYYLVLLLYLGVVFAQQVVAQEQQGEQLKGQQEKRSGEEEEPDDPEKEAEFDRQFLQQFTDIDTSTVVRAPEERLPFISINHKVYADSIVVRWAPSDRKTWLLANRAGYLLERVEYELTMTQEEIQNTDDVPRDYARKIIKQLPGPNQPIFPYDSVQWAPYFPNDDKYALIAAGASAGSLEVDRSNGFAVQGQQNQSIFGIVLLAADLSPLAADGLGLRYVDKEIEKGKSYEYRVTSLDASTISIFDSLMNIDPLDLLAAGDTLSAEKLMEWKQHGSTYAEYDEDHVEQPAPIEGLYSVSGDKKVAIRWSAEPYANEFSGYFLERSKDGGITWDSLTNNIFTGNPVELEEDTIVNRGNFHYVFEYLDLLDTNYVAYSYRIRGIDAFGDEGQKSIVKGMGRDLTAPKAPEIMSGEYLKKEGQIQIIYHLPEKPNDFSELYVEYANRPDTIYQRYTNESLSPYDSVYLHKPGRHEHSHYFKLVVVDTADNKSVSFPVFVHIPDTIPPPKPKGVLAKIDTTGKVHIEWDEEFIEADDLLGFRIYYSNSSEREFSQLTSKPEVSHFYSYKIPLNTLTEKIYFKVQAVDNSYNHSEFSDIVEAQKPDTIPPVGPVFRSPKISEDQVVLSWAPSSSQDVIGYLLTKQPKDGEPVVLMINDPETVSYTDQELEPGVRYYYTIVAVDDASLHSKNPYELQVKLVDKKRLEGISNLKAKYNKNQEAITISWDSTEEGDDVKYVIFRNVGEEKLKRYHLVDETKYVDKVSQEGTYYYGVRVVKKDGSKSSLSEAKSVRVNK